jgi:hypothetical protein
MPGKRKAPEAATGYVRAKEAFGVMYEGEQITVAAGEFVPAGHPVTKGREALFEPVTHFGRWDRPDEDEVPEVEQATAAPGEKRGE